MPVSTTEIIVFSKMYQYFQKLNTELLGLSIDSNASHLAWMYDIYCGTGIKIPFPIIADRSGEIARRYGMISSDVSNTETVRTVFIIDDKGIVRTILIYPLNVGRFIPEILRIIEALQMADCTNAATPVNWRTGNPVIMNAPQTFAELEERKNKK
jgi:peroxiredoxin (alkyl hydroperoxide reductase subunit C)